MTAFKLQHLALAALTAISLVGTAQAATPAADHPAVQRALGHLQGHGFHAARASLSDNFRATDLVVDADGTEHVRFERSYKGLPVIAGDLIVRSHASGQFQGLSQAMERAITVDTRPSLKSAAAKAQALKLFNHAQGAVQTHQLVVYAREATPKLAWQVRVDGVQRDGTPSEMHLILDAHTGAELDRWDDIHTADALGSGKTLHSGTVALHGNSVTSGFELSDATRGGHFVVDMKNGTSTETKFTDADNVWGTGATTNSQTVAADAAYGQNVTWDYFLNVHGRNGIANDGKGARSRVHYSTAYDNAFWSDSCFCMTYGDGSSFKPLVSLDVAGHEMTHGITSRTAKLIYSKESGGLNEATSDIFGTVVEFYAANANDPGDYKIGEKLATTPLRDMINPSSDGVSADCWYTNLKRLDVHWSSGVANHFFYLLSEGTTNGSPSKTCVSTNKRVATGNGTVTGIGRDKAAKIWYRALTTKMVASETYARARLSTVAAAEELYGVGSAEAQATAAAWTAVNVK